MVKKIFGRIWLVAVVVISVVVATPEAQAGTLYAVGRAPGLPSTQAIFRVDKATGQVSLVANLDPNLFSEATLAIDRDGTAFISDLFLVGSIDAVLLGRVDLATGAAQRIFPDGLDAHQYSGMAIAADGAFYASSSLNAFPRLYRLSRTTSAPTLIAEFPGRIQICGLATADDGRLFALSSTNLYAFNGATAALTLIGPHGIPFTRPDFIEQMGFTYDEEDGLLYATDSEFQDPVTTLYRLNPATGAATAIGPMGIRVTGLASVRGVTAIPALGFGGLALLAGLLALGAVGLLFRRSI